MVQSRLPIGFLLAFLMVFTNSGFAPRFQDATAVPEGADQSETIITTDTETPEPPEAAPPVEPVEPLAPLVEEPSEPAPPRHRGCAGRTR